MSEDTPYTMAPEGYVRNSGRFDVKVLSSPVSSTMPLRLVDAEGEPVDSVTLHPGQRLVVRSDGTACVEAEAEVPRQAGEAGRETPDTPTFGRG